MWIPMGSTNLGVDFEDPTAHPSRGEMLFYPGLLSEREILIPYGSAVFASKAGLLPGNHFATIEDKLDALHKIGQRTLWEGAKSIIIREG